MKRMLVVAAVLAACNTDRSAQVSVAAPPPAVEPAAPSDTKAEIAMDQEKAADKRVAKPEENAPVRAYAQSPARAGLAGGVANADEPAAGESEAAPSRSWFPESFLFEPLIVTDADGAAKVGVRVPDRLTTWRVLALAHSRAGAQAGTVTSFLGTLDTYVDVVPPPFLLVGDEVRLPVQVVNTTAAPIAAELRLAAENAALAPARTPVSVPANGSTVVYAALKTVRPGTVTLRAGLGDTDAVVRSFPVRPAGRPVTAARGGTLAAARTVELEAPPAADPAAGEVRVTVYPGALSILRAELAATLDRGGVAEDAYTLGLAGRAPALLAAFGDNADPDAVRQLALVAGQRAVHHARRLDVVSAALLGPAALSHPDNPVLARLAQRALETLATGQRPDGTFGGGNGWTLQRVLVATADATRAVQAGAALPGGQTRARAVALRAEGAVERNLDRIDDGYTAAAVLAAGMASGDLAARLAEKVRAGVKKGDDGARFLEIAEGVVRADGAVPGPVEGSALAILALSATKSAADADLLADLGTTVLGAYRAPGGWGDGRANLVCLDAVLRLFAAPVPPGIEVVLSLDGNPVTRGTIDAARLRDVLPLLAAAPAAGSHRWQLEAKPPTPGLAFALVQTSYVAWNAAPGHGLELAAPPPAELRVGKPATMVLHAAAPSGGELRIHQGLPAGVQVDGASLDKLVGEGTLSSWHFVDGAVELVAPALQPGQTFAAAYRVVPTLAGALRAPASTLSVGAAGAYELPPAVWTVR